LRATAGAHKTEGAFYVWTDEEIAALVGEDAPIARRRFGIEPSGNAPHDPQGEFRGRNLLYISQSIEDVAQRSGTSPDQVVAALGRVREKLFAARAVRPRPHRDDKILTAWNGLMIAALARASRVLADRPASSRYLTAARNAATFIRDRLWRAEEGRLLRRYRDGEAAIPGYAEDYAFMIFGLLELFQADGDPGWLDWAIKLQHYQDAMFWDEEQGGWFSTTGDDPTILLRLKEDYDGAEPAPSSISVLNLIAMSDFGVCSVGKAERTLARYGTRLGRAARVLPMMLAGLSAWYADHTQVVVVGQADQEGTSALSREIARQYRPFTVVLPLVPGSRQQEVASHIPFVGAMAMRNGRPTAYVCRNFTCREPVTSADALASQL
jgi:hypothetical protein